MLRFAAIALFLLPVGACAADRCPWLNRATAGAVLGGAAAVQVTHPGTNEDDASCAFELQHGDVVSHLGITVTTMRAVKTEFSRLVAQCGAERTELKAIGNEAFACGGADRHEHWERVAGRVRDRAFVIELRTYDATPPAALAAKAREVAEQVAGILF